MNRNLKKIIALALVVSGFNAIIPATNLNTTIIKAYAATGDLTSIKLKTSGGTIIKTYSDDDYKSKNEVDSGEMEDKEIYYAKTSAQKIKISTAGVDSNYVRIFKGKSSSTKGVKISSAIDLSSESTTTLIIRTYSKDPGTIKYSDDSYVSQYTIKVKYTGSSSDTKEENGDVYLKSINLSDGSISFSKSTSSYDVKVDESTSKITITAKPDCDSDEYDDYEVTIDGTIVDRDDKFKKIASLDKGKNKIEITVEDDNSEKRTYILNITRGQDTTTNTGSNNGATSGSNIKANQWVMVNGKWQYNDSSGNTIKNNWIGNYYLQSDGNMATGWLYYAGKWYYLGDDGAKKTRWQLVGGKWYYLDSDGKMQTGWIKDVDGRYYFLYTTGAMAYNTIIDGYKVGASGAWIG
ncbi:cadherin-like beta sandwich domain-containing protein [Clostridium saccharoperbutylacetonicum]|uniref:N-acetylmuramoyl-L-alanine amidase family protein n=1 Tax=Clostridium saccharoperbutylacetonicum TaxID=36745 RepID=UPI0039ED25BE